jgi:hypothetical protein
VKVRIDPPMHDGKGYDAISLWLDGVMLESKPIPSSDWDKVTFFDLFESLLRDGRINTLTYKIHRASENESESEPLLILYSRELPGGNDVPGTGDHPDLEISLPAELGDPPHIGKDEADKGVPVTLFYPFMKAYDKITLELNRERFTFTLQPGEDGKPYVIAITRAMFEQASSHPQFPISYTVVDQLNNPTHKRRWSRIIKADVDLERVTLTAPDLSEDPDDPSDDPDTIDLGKLKDYLYVLVHVFSPLWVAGDTLRVSYTCTPPTGPVVTHTTETTVGRLPFTHKLEVPAAKVLPDSQVQAIYEQVRDGKVIGTSKPARARVIGEGVVDEKPTIASVKGTSSGVEIPQAGTTVETSITLSGVASKGQKVQVLDGTASKGEPVADLNSGIWTLVVPNLSETLHSFTAKALYGSGAVSAARTLTVVPVMAPTITNVTDSKGPVPNNGSTVDKSVTLTGTASKGQKVQVLDGTASKGEPVADLNSGIWTLVVSNLSETFHSFTAKAKYANEPVSTPPRTFTVVASATPVITAVKDTKNVVIPQGGTTADTSVTLEGTASKGLTVEIFDGTASKGTATADANTGIWKLPVTGLAVSPTAHSFTAKAKYANEPVSTPPRTFTVVPALGLDPSPVTLNGYCFSIVGTTLGWEFSGTDKTGTYTDRVPTGGTPPYTYTSANPAVAAVDSRGRVRSTGNGSTRITATDRGLNTASYEVRVSNVRHLQHQPTPGYAQAVAAWVTAQGATTLTTSHHADLARFAAPGGANLAYWLGPPVVQVNPRAVNCALLAMYPPPNPPRVITTGWEDTPLQGLAIKRNDIAADQ